MNVSLPRQHCVAFIFCLLSAGLFGQPIDRLNDLPPTQTIPVPGFEIEKKFVFQIDDQQTMLYIFDGRRNPRNQKAHSVRMIYEIPLSGLIQNSFYLTESIDDSSRLEIRIGVLPDEGFIYQYFMDGKDVASVLSMDQLTIGAWPNSPKMKSTLTEAIMEIRSLVADEAGVLNLRGRPKMVHRFTAPHVKMIGHKQLDGKLNADYYFSDALTDPPLYEGAPTHRASKVRLRREIKELLSQGTATVPKDLPVIVTVAMDGRITDMVALSTVKMATGQVMD